MLKLPFLEKKYVSNLQEIRPNHYLIKGYASIFDTVDNHNDLITTGAFDESINRHNNNLTVKLLWQHNHQEPIGIIDSLHVDNIGLIMNANINEQTQRGREVISLINQKAINGLSIGFKVENHHYDSSGVRIITKANLWEISVVTFPANEQAQITLADSKSNFRHASVIDPAVASLTNITKTTTNITQCLNQALRNITKLNNF